MAGDETRSAAVQPPAAAGSFASRIAAMGARLEAAAAIPGHELRDEYAALGGQDVGQLAPCCTAAQAETQTPSGGGSGGGGRPLEMAPERHSPPPLGGQSPKRPKRERPAAPAERAPQPKPQRDRRALATNPRVLRYWGRRVWMTAVALARVNERARKGELAWLHVPREVYDLVHDLFDDARAVAGALDWVRRNYGPGIALEVEACALYRERGGVQHDDWSAPRARRKLGLLLLLLMSPHELPRSLITGSTSDEPMLVTAGVPQTMLVALLRSAQRDPYCVRTLQRDLAEIDECSDLLLRWRTPAAHAQPWERKSDKGVLNRYCIRARMVREQWRRARDAAESAAKAMMCHLATFMVWNPAPAKGSPVGVERGGNLATRPPPKPA